MLLAAIVGIEIQSYNGWIVNIQQKGDHDFENGEPQKSDKVTNKS